MIAPVLRRKGSVGLHTFTTPHTKPNPSLIRLRSRQDRDFRPAHSFSSGSPKDTRPPARVCTFADTACAARFLSTSCAPSITSYFPATCSRAAGRRPSDRCAGAWTCPGFCNPARSIGAIPTPVHLPLVQNSPLPREFGSAGILPALFCLNRTTRSVTTRSAALLTSTPQLGPCVALSSLC